MRQRAEYEAAARCSAAYYGQFARARLGLGALALRAAAGTRAVSAPANGSSSCARWRFSTRSTSAPSIIAFMADLGDKVDDVGVLSALGEIAEQHQDARGMLQLGKAALGPRPAARLLRVSDGRRAAAIRRSARHRPRRAVRHHSPGERVQPGRLVGCPRAWA